MASPSHPALPVASLRWHCDPADLDFDSTADVPPVESVVGQDAALEALRFGLETQAPGQNIYVRGLSGTGRLTSLRRTLEELQPQCPSTHDRCYVHNFAAKDRPRLITLSGGQGASFRRRVDELADFIRDQLGVALASEGMKARKAALDKAADRQLERIIGPVEKALAEAHLALVTVRVGPTVQSTLLPLVEGKPVPPEEFDQLHAQGDISDEFHAEVRANFERFKTELAEIQKQATAIRNEHQEKLRALVEESARSILEGMVRGIEADFPSPDVKTFLAEVLEDVLQRLESLAEEVDFTPRYRVNVVSAHGSQGECPIIVESSPSIRNLVGTVEYEMNPEGVPVSSHLGVRVGSLARADGGYLIMEVRDLLAEPGAWRVLVRTLRSGQIEIAPPEQTVPWSGPSLKPEPIPIAVKIILLGDSEIYYMLDALDPDFPDHFKVLVDFDTVIPRDPQGVRHYAAVLSRLARDEDLLPFHRTAVAALAEHGARIASSPGKLTARFGRLADIAREAAFLASRGERKGVVAEHVWSAVERGRRRADLPARRFRERVADGMIRIETRETRVGQINGLAVLAAGPIVFGFPARISATIGPGTAGVINIEREAALSGAIHTKGFYILGGLLRTLLRTDHPLAFDASVAFEQSYGGIDGDSASGAEICCLLSALTDTPLRQGIAMTGAIDQVGNILAVGAVNEKIEGFFDACSDRGLSGDEGVIIPSANAADLMLRGDIVDACQQGRFRVHAVETVHDALEILTGLPAGERDDAGHYPKGTILGQAMSRARDYWRMAATAPHLRDAGADDGTRPAEGSGEGQA